MGDSQGIGIQDLRRNEGKVRRERQWKDLSDVDADGGEAMASEVRMMSG